jgi:hypothetical protein
MLTAQLTETLEKSVSSLDAHRQAVLTRLVVTIARGLANSSDEKIHDFEAQEGTLLLSALAQNELAASKLPADRRARMYLKGMKRFNTLIMNQGGTYTLRQAATHLRKTENSVKRGTRHDRKQYLSFMQGENRVLPVAQFAKTGRVPGIKDVWQCLPADLPDIEVTRFFLSPASEAEPLSPLTLLAQGADVEEIKLFAEQYAEQRP